LVYSVRLFQGATKMATQKRQGSSRLARSGKEGTVKPAPVAVLKGFLDDEMDRIAREAEAWVSLQEKDVGNDEEACTTALAAFRLGYAPYLYRMRQREFCTGGQDCEKVGVYMLIAIDQLRKSAFTLAERIHPNVYLELPHVLELLQSLAESLLDRGLAAREAFFAQQKEAMRWQGKTDAVDYATVAQPIPVEGRALWKALCSLTERALIESSSWMPLRAFGTSLGRLSLQVYQHKEQEPVPSWADLLQCSRSLPEQLLQHNAMLENKSRLAPEKVDIHLKAFIKRRFPAAMEIRQIIGWMLDGCRADVEETLKEVKAEPARGCSEKGPRWERDEGVLYFDGVAERKVKIGVAANSVRILDAFQEGGWPKAVENPLVSKSHETRKWPLNPQQLYQAVDTLNEGLRRMRFRVQGNNVIWDQEEPT
jgi:hypothetical protein